MNAAKRGERLEQERMERLSMRREMERLKPRGCPAALVRREGEFGGKAPRLHMTTSREEE